jgi:hypothetical protein
LRSDTVYKMVALGANYLLIDCWWIDPRGGGGEER